MDKVKTAVGYAGGESPVQRHSRIVPLAESQINSVQFLPTRLPLLQTRIS